MPTPVIITAQSLGSVTLSWGASSDDIGIARYEVIGGGGGSTTGTTFTDTHGRGSRSYAIRAVDLAGHTATSDSITVLDDFSDTTPPTTPGLPFMTSNWEKGDYQHGDFNSYIGVAFAPSTDDSGSVSRYEIYKDGVFNGYAYSPSFAVKIANPVNGAIYQITVKAVDASENSSAASPACAITYVDPASAPVTPGQDRYIKTLRVVDRGPQYPMFNIDYPTHVYPELSLNNLVVIPYTQYNDNYLHTSERQIADQLYQAVLHADHDPLMLDTYGLPSLPLSYRTDTNMGIGNTVTWVNTPVDPPPLLTTTVNLSARAKSGLGVDSDITYTWSQVSGSPGVTFSPNGTNAARDTLVNCPQAGLYTVRVVAACRGASASTDVKITRGRVTWARESPSSTTTVTGAQINLSTLASASFAPESEITYTWRVSSGPAASFSVNNSNAARSTIATVSLSNTYYQFSCTATCRGVKPSDANGWSQIDYTMYVHVVGLYFAQSPMMVRDPLTGTCSSRALAQGPAGSDSAIVYSWSVVTGPAVTWTVNNSNAAKIAPLTFGVEGDRTLRCTASYAGMTIHADFYGGVQGIYFQRVPSSYNNFLYPDGPTMSLDVLAGSDFRPESEIIYKWSMSSGPAPVTFTPNNTNAAKSTQVTFTASGQYSFRCTATVSTFSVTNDVNVINNALTFTQVATVTPNPVTAATASVSALASTGLGADSGITYAWSMVSGPAPVTFAASGTNAAKNTTVTFTQPGSYQFRCTGTYQAFSATSDVNVTNAALTFTQVATATPYPLVGVTAYGERSGLMLGRSK